MEVYHLEGVSGKSVIEHPEAKRMLRDIARGHISGLIFSKLARLARSTRELLDFADLFKKHNADLISLQESIDTSSPAGRLFYTMIAALAQWEREEIGSRVSASIVVRAKLGKAIGGKGPYGFMWKDKHLIHNPDEAPIRKKIFDLFLQHRRIRTVARILNEQGIRTRNGAQWSAMTVERLIKDSSAKGLRRANYSNVGAWGDKPSDQWILTEVEPIVSAGIWDECNAILTGRIKHAGVTGRKPAHVFSGIVVCHCGGKMYVPSNTKKYVCFNKGCRNKIGVKDLDDIFHSKLKAFVFSKEEIADHLTLADTELKEKEELLATIEKERGKVKAGMDRLLSLYMDGQLPKEGFGEKYKPMDEQYQQIGSELPRLQSEVAFLRVRFQSSSEVLSEAQTLYGRWAELTMDERRLIAETIVERITIEKDGITFVLNHLPTKETTVA